MWMLGAALGTIDRVERAIVAIALLMMIAIMLVVSCDVAMRYIFNRPLWWAYDFIGVYMMCGMFFLMLSRTYWLRSHIAVDLLQRRLSTRSQRLSELATALVGAAAFAVMTYAAGTAAISSFSDWDTTASGNWPTWPAFAMAPLGCGLLTLRLVIHAAAQVLSILHDEDVLARFRSDDVMQAVTE